MIPGYIYDRSNLTKEDIFVLVRRTITSVSTIPVLEEFGNGWVEQNWYGDITKWSAYVEYDEAFKE